MSKRNTATKSRLSGIVDRSSMGLSLNTEMELTEYTFNLLKYCLYKAYTKGINNFKGVKLLSAEGAYKEFKIPDLTKRGKKEGILKSSDNKRDSIKSKSGYLLSFNNRDGSENSMQYELKQEVGKYFINVTGNPSALVYGANDIPILIIGSNHDSRVPHHIEDDSGKKYNSATVTFKYMNRIMYAILDWLLEEHGFEWLGDDKQKLLDGDISISSYQLAWYSSDLGSERDNYMRYLKTTYVGLNNTSRSSDNFAYSLGLTATGWDRNTYDKENNNITLMAKSGANKAFSLTWYAKDTEPGYDNDNEDRLSSLIRWDCTLNNAFLNNNNIKSIAQLEELYISECDKHGYDIGFVRYIQTIVSKRLKLDYVLSLTADKFKKGLHYLENATSKYQKLLADLWLEDKKIPNSFVEVQKIFYPTPINKSKYYGAKKALLDNGIDILIPRSFYSALIEARILATRTIEEREASILLQRNRIIPLEELIEREKVRNEKFMAILNSSNGVLGIRKFSPKKISPADFWIFNIKDKEEMNEKQ